MDTGAAHLGQGGQPVGMGVGGDDLAIELGAGVQVVVVVVQAGSLEPLGLAGFEHTQGDAGLQAQGLDLADHLRHGFQVAVLGPAPGRAHAESGGAARLGGTRGLDDLGHVEQTFAFQPGVVAGRLRTVAAVFGTPSGLHRQQSGQLHTVRIEMLPVHARRPVDQIVERQRVQGLDRPRRPRAGHLGHRGRIVHALTVKVATATH